jgi:hypothetical protein
MNTGVYEIVHLATGRRYIGSTSQSFVRRWRLHRIRLRQGKHHNRHLQNAWNAYGPDAFEFRKLVICAPDMVLFYEQLLLDGLKPEFNHAPTAGSMRGATLTDEHKAKIGAGQRKWRKKYAWKGAHLTLTEVAEMEGIQPDTLISRVLSAGMSLAAAVAKGPLPSPKALSLPAFCRLWGISDKTVTTRLKAGEGIGEALRPPRAQGAHA